MDIKQEIEGIANRSINAIRSSMAGKKTVNIDGFKAVMARNPLLDLSRYSVTISGPQKIGPMNPDHEILCSVASVPGRGFSSTDKYTHGPIRKVPYAEMYDEVSTTFYMTNNMAIHSYFDMWQTLIGGEDYYMAYYDDIIGSVVLSIEDKEYNIRAQYELFEAWPSSIGPIEMGYANGNRIAEFTVNWAYHHFERKYIENEISGPVKRILDSTLLDEMIISKGITAANKALGKMNLPNLNELDIILGR